MYNPRAQALTAVEHMDVSPCVQNDIHEVKKDAKKKEEHLYSAMSKVRLPLSPVYIIFSFTDF